LSIYPGGVDRLSAALMGSCAYCERLSILGEFELLHALASVVLSLCLFLEEPVLCHCMTVLSPASFFEGSCFVDRLRRAVAHVFGDRFLALVCLIPCDPS